MTSAAIVANLPRPPSGRLAFPLLIARLIGNPIAAWGTDFYEEPLIVYRWMGIETAFVMDPETIQAVLLADSDRYSKQPLYDDVLGDAIGGGLLSAEGDAWRWQRRLAAPLFRAEEMLGLHVRLCQNLHPAVAALEGGSSGRGATDQRRHGERDLACAAGYCPRRQSR